jgi:hypothetical protein
VAEALMRGLRPIFVLLAILLGLVGYIYFYEMKRPGPAEQAEQKQKVFSVDAEKIEEVQVKAASGERTVLKKSNGRWNIVDPVAAKADEGEASGLVTSLASLEIQRVIDENPRDIAQYGLASPRVEIGFKRAGQADAARLFIGEKTATGGELYAKLPSEKRVFLVSAFLDATFNKATFDLRDKTILAFERDKVDTVEPAWQDQRVAFAKAGERWTLAGSTGTRVDSTQVEGVVGRLQTLAMKSIVAAEVNDRDLAKYGLDKPAVTATIGAGSARATLALGKADETGNLYARDLSKRAVVTVEAALADELKKKADDYRPKEVFEFRSFNATRLEITRGSSTATFERVKGKDGVPKWQRLNPTKDVGTTEIEGLLAAVSALTVERYVDAKTKNGADSPVAVVVAAFEDGKRQERVVFGKVGSDVFALRAGEPGAAKVDAAKFDDTMKLVDSVK